MAVLAALKRCDVLLGLTDGDLAKIANLPSSREEAYQVGETIFEEGDVAENLYLLDEGKVNLTMEVGPYPLPAAVVETVTKGGVFGWSALVVPHILTHSAICVERCRVITIKGKELTNLMDDEPGIGYEIMNGLVRVISSRLRNTQRLIISSGQTMIL
ncbi:MAG: hypothetical protein A2Y60_03185 [Chloroflexi bacterium RBG_13_54_9]|nr:MAG: hypothetical protein A2Y60_03185 [Chloroflexi bacterium RBG_13_54_9]